MGFQTSDEEDILDLPGVVRIFNEIFYLFWWICSCVLVKDVFDCFEGRLQSFRVLKSMSGWSLALKLGRWWPGHRFHWCALLSWFS
jgi:hypothetical protein